MGWSINHTGSVPEHIIDDPSAASPMGYAQSKYIAEHLLNTASQIPGISTNVIRVGQVAGPVETNQSGGCWNKQEWLPSLLASSLKLGKLPNSLGPNDVIDWIPVDVLSGILVELMEASPVDPNHPITESHHQDHTSPLSDKVSAPSTENDHNEPHHLTRNTNSATVHHAINPNHTTWSTLLPTIQSRFADNSLKIVSLPEWVNSLKESANDTQEPNLNPAIRLLDFYENLAKNSSHANPVFDTAKTVKSSRRLAALGAVRSEWMKLWLEQWDF